MIKTVFCSTLALVAGSAIVCYADGKADATAAAEKLAGTSYSWKTTTEAAGGGGGRGGGPQEGKTSSGVTMTTITFGDNSIVSIRKGDKSVTKNQDGEWMTPEEMAAAGNGRGRGRGGAGAPMLPAETVKDLISKSKDLKDADGGLSGELTEDGAKGALTFGGRGRRGGGGGNNAGPTNAKGTLKVWIKDGAVSKYQIHVTGTVSRGGNDTDVDRTTTTEFSDIGSTKVEVPEAAAKKLQ
jgi:hypothetical protein